MLLTVLLFAAALSLATAAGIFSVIGLAITYGGSFWAIVALGSSIEAGKLMAVSFLYRFWSRINWAFKIALSTMVIGVMLVTSIGVFGFLVKANQTDMVGLTQNLAQQEIIAQERQRLELRKQQIDEQIAQLPANFVSGRVRLQREFEQELSEINRRIPEIIQQQADLAALQIQQQADVGPFVFIARTFGYEIDLAITWFTILIVLVFDPLAVLLVICGNMAYMHYRREKEGKLALVSADEVQPKGQISEQPSEHQSISPEINNETQPIRRFNFSGLGSSMFGTATTHTNTTSEPRVVYHQKVRPFAFVEHEGVELHPFEVIEPDSTEELTTVCSLSQNDRKLIETDWVHYYNKHLSQVATSGQSANMLDDKLEQLQSYINELDGRGDDLSTDEIILRDRIVNFIKRHK